MGIDLTAIDLEFTPGRVKRIRVLLGESQEEFARRLGVNPNMVTRWETDTATPQRGKTLKALLDAEREALT